MKRIKPFKPSFLKLLFTVTAFYYSCIAHAQDNLPNKALQVIGGYSKHGSGDYNGIVFGAEYIKYFSNKFSLSYNMRASINDGIQPIIINNAIAGTRTDASIRFTTAGVQLGANGQFSFIRTRRSELLISLGAFGRYQSASNGSDGYQLYDPQVTGQPTILVGYDNRTPQETFAVGGILQVGYNYTFNRKMYVGILPGFQTDTNGDAIPQVALTIGKRL